MPKEIPLTGGGFTLVDDDMYDYLMQWKWGVTRGYAYRKTRKGMPGRKTKTIYMHRVIMNAGPNDIVDHINGNKLDNRRENLRIVTKSQNNVNRGPQANNVSGYRGVHWYSRYNKWTVGFSYQGRFYWGGYFDCPHEAARKYNEMALEILGEYAWLNEIHDEKERGA